MTQKGGGMNHDMVDEWKKEHINKAKSALNRLGKAYNWRSDKEQSFAKGIKRMIVAYKKIITIWENA